MTMRRILREPLLHFALLGGLLFALQSGWRTQSVDAPIVVTATDQERLANSWLRDTGRRPSEAELSALLHQHVDEELLLREAHRLGLERRDPVVRERLIRNMRFAEQNNIAKNEALVQAAMAMGMTNTDLVIRRRLIQLMRHRIESKVRIQPSEAQQFLAVQEEAQPPQPRYSFQQIYFKQRPYAEVSTALQQLRLNAYVKVVGDPFLLGDEFAYQTPEKIDRLLGSDVVQLLASAKPGEWFGPVTTVYGQHLLRLNRVDKAEQASGPLVSRLFSQREDEALRLALEELRDRYPVRVLDGES